MENIYEIGKDIGRLQQQFLRLPVDVENALQGIQKRLELVEQELRRLSDRISPLEK